MMKLRNWWWVFFLANLYILALNDILFISVILFVNNKMTEILYNWDFWDELRRIASLPRKRSAKDAVVLRFQFSTREPSRLLSQILRRGLSNHTCLCKWCSWRRLVGPGTSCRRVERSEVIKRCTEKCFYFNTKLNMGPYTFLTRHHLHGFKWITKSDINKKTCRWDWSRFL